MATGAHPIGRGPPRGGGSKLTAPSPFRAFEKGENEEERTQLAHPETAPPLVRDVGVTSGGLFPLPLSGMDTHTHVHTHAPIAAPLVAPVGAGGG